MTCVNCAGLDGKNHCNTDNVAGVSGQNIASSHKGKRVGAHLSSPFINYVHES